LSLAIVIILVCSALQSCKVKTPSGIMNEEEMTNLLYDYHKAQIMAEESGDRQANTEIYTQAVLDKYGITRDEFNKSVEYYARHADQLYDIYNSVNEAGNALSTANTQTQATVDDAMAAKQSHKGSKVDVRALNPQMLYPGKQVYSFSLTCDKSWSAGDSVEWRFNTKFIFKEGARNAEAVLTIRYSGDSIVTQQQPIYGDGDNLLTLVLPGGREQSAQKANARSFVPRMVEGYIYFDVPLTAQSKFLFLSHASIAHIHYNKEKPSDAAPKDALKNDSIRDTTEIQKKHFIDSLRGNKQQGSHWK